MKFNNAKILQDAQNKVAKAVEETVIIMGVYATNHYKKSFVDGGFTDETLELWKPRKRTERSRQGNRGVLIGLGGGGGLKNSIKALRRGRFEQVIRSNKVYANVHNEGLRAGRGKGFIMPKRKIVGYSGVLSRKIENKLNSKIRAIFK